MNIKHYYSVLQKNKQPLKFLVSKLLFNTGLCRFWTIQQDGYKLRFHPSNLACQLWINPKQREDELVFFDSYLKSGDYVIDVGANIGDTVLKSSGLVGKQGKVIGIEAHPRTFSFFRDNLKLNNSQNVQAINSAIGDVVGELEFSDDWRDDMNRVGAGNLKVSVQTLDDLIVEKDPISLLKIDVEGYEKFVILGSLKILNNVQCIYFEVGEKHFAEYDYSIKDLLLLLEEQKFQIFKIINNEQLFKVTPNYKSNQVENLVALRDPLDFINRTSWKIIDN